MSDTNEGVFEQGSTEATATESTAPVVTASAADIFAGSEDPIIVSISEKIKAKEADIVSLKHIILENRKNINLLVRAGKQLTA